MIRCCNRKVCIDYVKSGSKQVEGEATMMSKSTTVEVLHECDGLFLSLTNKIYCDSPCGELKLLPVSAGMFSLCTMKSSGCPVCRRMGACL